MNAKRDQAREDAPSVEKLSVEQLFTQLQKFPIPPVARWHPEKSLDIDLRIKADGRWYYRGSEIVRARIVKLFGSVLRLQTDGNYFLITPQLKYPIRVDEAPFQAVELKRQGVGREQKLIFRTNLDEVVIADSSHPIHVRIAADGQPSPTVEVRDGLRAKITRSVYYELAQMVVDEDDKENGETLGVYSSGVFFALG